MIKLLVSIVIISMMCNNANAKKNVKILSTGGTIAGKAQELIGYASGQLNIAALIAEIPDIQNHTEISWQQVANIGSQDMGIEIWKTLYMAIEDAKNDNDVLGIVITHGTDTMIDSAFLFDLLFPSGKPLIFVGAMRNADALSPDGPQNLLDAIQVASSVEAKNRGALIVMNSKIITARSAYKQHTAAVETFKISNGSYAGDLHNGKVNFYHDFVRERGNKSIFNFSDIDGISQVAMMSVYPGTSKSYYENALSSVNKALVISGVGNGNFPSSITKNIKETIDSGVIIVRSSKVPEGYVSRNIEINDDQLGTIASLGLSPQKSRILLGLLLKKNMSNSQVQKIFDCEVPTADGSCSTFPN